jgi:hypothetical protein
MLSENMEEITDGVVAEVGASAEAGEEQKSEE